MKFFLSVLVFSFWITSVCAEPVIKFATEATYPPFVYMNASGKMEGFDAAIVRALCAQIHATCTLSNQAWDSLIPSLKLGKYDALFGGMAITATREKQVDFTQAYYHNTVSVIASKTSHLKLSLSALKGKTIGVQSGTTFDAYLQDKYANTITINRYPSIQDALMDLLSGRVDAVIGDTPVLQQWLSQKGHSAYVAIGRPIDDPNYFGDGNGIAVKKGNTALLRELNAGLNQIEATGAYQKIVMTYFGK